MASFLLRRLANSVLVVCAVSFLVFILVHVSGDPLAALRAAPGASRETVDSLVERHHLDEPVVSQYGHWLENVVTDGLGKTLISERPIAPDLLRAFGNTAQLVIPALVVGAFVGLGLGTLSAARHNSLFDHGAMTVMLALLSMPQFWVALLLQVLFTNLYLDTGVRILYTSGLSSGGGLLDRAQHLALPVLVLSIPLIVIVARFVRSSVLDSMGEAVVRAALAKGLSSKRVLYRHVLKRALPPVLTLLAASVPLLFGQAVIIEAIFSIDGFGRYLLGALEAGDVYPVMAALLVTSVLTVLSSLVADFALASIDPRVRAR